MELLGMVTMPADVIQNPMFRLVPLKGARAAGEGRLVMLAPAPATARALAMYLRARRHHPLADSDWACSGPGDGGGYWARGSGRCWSAEDGCLVLDGTVPDLGEDGVTMTAGRYRATEVCDQGIADKLGIRAAYLRRMREACPELYDANVNG
jgi:hypothetical protein